MNRFFVYLHTKLDTGEVFYVGKGEGRRYLSRCGRSAWWKRTVEKHGLKSEIIERFTDEADAFALERYLIASYRALGARLLNMTDGGDGATGRPMSIEHRRRISEAQRGQPNDPAQNAAHSEPDWGNPDVPRAGGLDAELLSIPGFNGGARLPRLHRGELLRGECQYEGLHHLWHWQR
jgi:hypothetical protein